MIVAVSALDVAFVSAIAAIIGATVSPLSGWLVTKATQRHERSLRIYDDRRDAYLSVLAGAWEARHILGELIRVTKEERPEDFPVEPAIDPAQVAETWAKVAAFTSPRVRAAVEAFQRTALSIEEATWDVDLDDPTGRAEYLRRLQETAGKLDSEVRAVRDLIHKELTA